MVNRNIKFLVAILVLVLTTPLPMQGGGGGGSAGGSLYVAALKVENMSNPLGIDTDRPRFSWIIGDHYQNKGVYQKAYHIIVSSTYEKMKAGEGDLWNTGWVESDEQLWIPYAGKPLGSNRHCWWNVRVKTNKGETKWNHNPNYFSTGLLNESKWSGYWIGLERLMPGEERGFHTRLAARYLRKEFTLKQSKVKRATAFVAGLGLYEFYVNGQRIGHDVLTPVPSDYRKTIYYNTYDVTSSINHQPSAISHQPSAISHQPSAINHQPSSICLGIILGNGRYFPMQQHKPYKIPVFGLPKCRINVVVEYDDGTTQRLQTDDKGWKVTASGPIRSNNEYDGEEYDARMELTGWATVGYDDSQWLKAERTDIPTGQLRGQMTPGMTLQTYHRLMKPAKTIPGPVEWQELKPLPGKPDTYVIDFGQNMAGWVSLMPHGKAGDTIRVRYAEKLNADGTLYTENLRNARSTDTYVCNGHEPVVKEWDHDRAWRPTFVYHGFRYVEVSGMKDLDPRQLVAEEVYDGIAVYPYSFSCSDTILNKVVQNACMGIAANYKGMPVDCPQRDERQPWLGDRTMGSLGESFVADNERIYTKWMRDICEAQRSDGCIPDVAPAFWNYYSDDVTWAAALPFGCDMLWRQFGNRQPIDDCYPYIKKWVHHIIEEYSQDGIIHCGKYADWCVPPESLELIHSQDPARKTDVSLISTAYIIRTMQLMEQWGCEADHWQPIREQMTAAFNRQFLTVRRGTSPRPGHVLYPDSVFYGNNTATANLLALSFGIVPDDCRDDVVKQVVENICVKNKGHVPCGVIGISWLLRGLSDNGFSDVAYLIATQKSYPSWGYMAENGATTTWELWNGDKASPRMNSGNHVMLLGDLLTWCYQYLGGIRQEGNAYKHVVLKPAFDIQNCEQVRTAFHSPYGDIHSEWKKTLQHVDWHVLIPCNVTADVCLPDGTVKTVGSGSYDFSCDIPTSHPAIMKDEFLYDHTFFPEAHASTIVETKKGDLVTAYFGGTHERDPDVCIYVSIREKGGKQWSQPILAADGVLDLHDANAPLMGLSGLTAETTSAEAGPVKSLSDEKGFITYDYKTKKSLVKLPETLKRKSCWNPVLFEMPDGELWLFFKIGTTVGDWTGWITKSKDGGRTWSDKQPLGYAAVSAASMSGGQGVAPQSPSDKKFPLLGPIKNKPELIDGRLLCGASTEGNGWRFHMEILDTKTGQWSYIPVESTVAVKTDDNLPHPIDCIQPSILRLKDGRLQVLMRTHNARLATSFSSDNGLTWTPVTLSEVENNQSGTDAVTLKDGRHALIYNNFETLPLTKKGVRTPLSIALSSDGQSWHHALTLEDSPIDQYSYPAIIQGRNGHLYCVYTWRRQRVAFKEINLKAIK